MGQRKNGCDDGETFRALFLALNVKYCLANIGYEDIKEEKTLK